MSEWERNCTRCRVCYSGTGEPRRSCGECGAEFLEDLLASRDRMRETLRQALAAWDAETAEMCDGAPEPERNVYDVLSEREPWLWGENDDG